MRTINSSSINNINNTSTSASTFDSSAKRIRPDAPSSRSFSASAAAAAHDSLTVKRLVTAKSSHKSPVALAPTPQARPRFPSAPVALASDSRPPPPSCYHDHKQQQHVLALTTTTTRSTSASKMPPDSRPRPPQLSAAAAKNIGRTPLTPKIATKGAPLARRTRDDGASTPRLGNRQSTNSTPNGTPNLERGHDGWDPRATLAIDSTRGAESPGESADSKFFYASDARPASQPPSRPSSAVPKSSTFFYANKVPAESKRAMSPPVKSNFTPILATPPEPTQSKFFYASGTPETSSNPNLQNGPPSSGSSGSRAMNGRPSTSGSAAASSYAMPPRPLSPVKMLQQHNPPPILKNSTTPGLHSRAQLSSAQFVSTPPITKRRISIDSAPRGYRGHARTSSIPSIPSIDGNSPRVTLSPPPQFSEPSSPPASPIATQPIMTMASILQAAEEFGEEEDDAPSPDIQSPNIQSPNIQSPTKSTHAPHTSDPLTELVANARRERKVQDLEITNASLEAINRTLERQLRKQTAEIRRYRRLSRAGHLAVASEAPSRVPSQTLADIPISITEDLSEDDDDSIMSEDEPDSFDESELSSAELASAADHEPVVDTTDKTDKIDKTDENTKDDKDDKVTVRRKRDERRLQLDLTKHHELLVDSQKINQSLKRCLNWTEVLIKEGQKALEYKVSVSDVKFGGHVLAPPDEDDGVSQLGSELLETLDLELEPLPNWEKSSQDRDSGIELQPEAV